MPQRGNRKGHFGKNLSYDGASAILADGLAPWLETSSAISRNGAVPNLTADGTAGTKQRLL